MFQNFTEIRRDNSALMKRQIPRIRAYVADGRPVFCFFTNNFEGYAPGSAMRFKEIIGQWFRNPTSDR